MGKPIYVCNECPHMRRAPSLFPEFEIVECANRLYKTLNVIPVGGIEIEVENVTGMVSV